MHTNTLIYKYTETKLHQTRIYTHTHAHKEHKHRGLDLVFAAKSEVMRVRMKEEGSERGREWWSGGLRE